MSDDSLINTTEIDKRKKMALGISVSLTVLQVLLLLTYRSYLDFGHLILTILYAVVVLVAFWSLRKAKIIPAIVSIVVAAALLYGGIAKMRWNESYLQGLTTPQAFIFEDYIEKYPTLEQHIFAKTLRQKDWIRLGEWCIKPALKRQPVPGFCRTPEGIQDMYRIDVQAEMEKYLRRMQKTAKDIQDGRIESASQYQNCIAQRQCAPIPLLPDDVAPDTLDPKSTQYADIRQAFWDLVEEKGITAPICLSMTLCRGLRATGVVDFGDGVTYSDTNDDDDASENAAPPIH